MAAATAGGTVKGMPPKTDPPAMTPAELRELLDACPATAGKTSSQRAAYLGFSRSHLFRWLKGDTEIDVVNAVYLRSKLRPKPQPKTKRKKG